MTSRSSSNPVAELRKTVVEAAESACQGSAGSVEPKFERPPQAEFGDYSTNAAMLFASGLDRNPREIAQKIRDRLADSLAGQLEKTEIAGPGFVNLFLGDEWFKQSLEAVTQSGKEFGSGVAEAPEQMNIEFVSANPTGPLHIGHGRHAAFGDSLARILEFAGHRVTREFYINDYGGQIEKFGASIAARKKGQEIPEGGYAGDYINELAEKISEVDEESVEQLAKRGMEIMLESIRKTLSRFRVGFDVWFAESKLHEKGSVEKRIQQLKKKGLAYEKEGAVWLETTQFGDDKDRVLVRSSGDSTYFAADIAYFEVKRSREKGRLVYIWGADHHGYVRRMKAAYQAIGGDAEQLEILIMQLVQILEKGERAQMSKRKGEFVTLDELIDDIGVDAARFFLMQRSHDTAIDLDLDLAREQSQDNPVYYIQYAHARICSILQKAKEEGGRQSGGDADGCDFALHASERELVKKILEFPELVKAAAESREPHMLTTYSTELAADFHVFYRDCRVVGAEPASAEAFRLDLCRATRQLIAQTLELLGVSAPEQM